MSFGARFSAAFATGRTSTSLVPDPWPVALGGRVFEIDTNQQPDVHSHSSVQYLTKFLTSPVFGSPTSVAEVGESSLNPDISWRRSAAGWNHGAGQIHFDLRESDRARFRSSKGIDPWTLGQISLLHDTASKRASANTNLALVTAGSYLYCADGSALKWTTDLTAWSDAGVTTTVNSVTSDGHTVWAALPGGVYQTTRGTTTSALYNDLVPDVLGYAKDRLMAGKGPALYNITTGHISVPTGLALAVNGTAGTTHYSYRVSAKNSAGETLACTEVTTTTGNATLSATNSISLTWTAVTGASSYVVYGRATGAELKIAVVSTNTYTDDGTVVTPAGALPSADTTGAAPTALFTHPNTDWKWVGFATGDSAIYAAGFAGDYSAVYRLPIKADGSGLDAAVQAGELPKGETALSVGGYLQFITVGTSSGVRLATQAASGELQFGSVIPVGPVRCSAGFGRFVWVGWENYDATSTGLGRFDVTVINGDAPAYATDVQAAAQGNITSVVIFNSVPAFTVSGVGVFAQTTDLVASGQLDGGLITFDLPDPKVAQAIDVRHSNPLVGSHALWLAADEGTFSLLGTHTTATAETPFSARDTKAEVFELRHVLTRSGTDTTAGPAINRHTLMAIPAALSGETISVPLLLRSYAALDSGMSDVRNPADDLAFLKGLRRSKQSFAYQEGATTYRATLADYQWLPSQMTTDRSAWEGTFVAQLLVQDLDL